MPSLEVCARCKGEGYSPVTPNLFCRECWGSGLAGPDVVFRMDGRVEVVCDHGVGHTVCVRACRYRTEADRKALWAHGCCGSDCCRGYERIE